MNIRPDLGGYAQTPSLRSFLFLSLVIQKEKRRYDFFLRFVEVVRDYKVLRSFPKKADDRRLVVHLKGLLLCEYLPQEKVRVNGGKWRKKRDIAPLSLRGFVTCPTASFSVNSTGS